MPCVHACRGLLYDLAMDASAKIAVTVGQDAAIRVLDVATGKQTRVIQQDAGVHGERWHALPSDAGGVVHGALVQGRTCGCGGLPGVHS